MSEPDFEKIDTLLKEIEAMCQRAKQLRAELADARAHGRFWRGRQDVRKSFTADTQMSEAGGRKANLN